MKTNKTNKQRCLIFGAAEQNAPRLANLLSAVFAAPTEMDYLIAADGGLSLMRELHLTPDVIIGDFDSCKEESPKPEKSEMLAFPPEKDDTDTMLAVKKAITEGCNEIILLGCMGGSRFDHTLATLQTLIFGANRNIKISALCDDGTVVTALCNGQFVFPSDSKGYFSVFAADGECKDISITGAKYPLCHATLTSSFPLGVSNAFLAGETTAVTVKEGTLWVVWKIGFSA